MTRILGILNITRDSFSDGGCFVQPQAAIEHAVALHAGGADFIDIGAESTNPHAQAISIEEEVDRLTPVVRALREKAIPVSIDTYKPAVMRAMLALGAAIINDVRGMRADESIAAVRPAAARLIVMFSTSPEPRAQPSPDYGPQVVDMALEFFHRQIARLTAAGIAPSRIILDPGMGLFLSARPESSVAMLRAIPRLRALGFPLCISLSRKGFLSALAAGGGPQIPAQQRSAATLAGELWAASQQVDFIRTHDAGGLRQALRVWQALAGPEAVRQ